MYGQADIVNVLLSHGGYVHAVNKVNNIFNMYNNYMFPLDSSTT